MLDVIRLKQIDRMQAVNVAFIYKLDEATLLHNAIITKIAETLIKLKPIKANLFFLSSIVHELIVRSPATESVKQVNSKSVTVPFSFSTPNKPKMASNADKMTKIIVNKEIFFFI